MRHNAKIFMPLALAIIIGSLTFMFAQTGDKPGGKFPGGAGGEGRGFGPGRPGGHGIGIPPQVLDKLSLTDAQKQQIQALQDSARSSEKENFDKIKTFDDQLKTMIDGGTFNEEQARQILNGKAQIMTELEISRLRTDFAIRNILTAEQRTQLETFKQQRPDFGRGPEHERRSRN